MSAATDRQTCGRRILVFTGDGKGKTTAAIGTAVRAVGHGKRVLILQFIKQDRSTGELAALAAFPNVTFEQAGAGFVLDKAEPVLHQHRRLAMAALARAAEAISSGQYDVVVLDEVCIAVSLGLIDKNDLLAILQSAPDGITLILTGRYAPSEIVEFADTVSEIRPIKHAFNRGIVAQQGVEW